LTGRFVNFGVEGEWWFFFTTTLLLPSPFRLLTFGLVSSYSVSPQVDDNLNKGSPESS
jgi:hypothetical protein